MVLKPPLTGRLSPNPTSLLRMYVQSSKRQNSHQLQGGCKKLNLQQSLLSFIKSTDQLCCPTAPRPGQHPSFADFAMAARVFSCSTASAPPAFSWAAKNAFNKRDGQRCSRGQLLHGGIKAERSKFRAAAGTPLLLRLPSAHIGCSSNVTQKRGKVGRNLGQAGQIGERVSVAKGSASAKETTGVSSKEHSFNSKGGPNPIVESTVDILKQCTECQHLKLLIDFEATTTSADGLYEVCRACMAACRARRNGQEHSHLHLSVAEAWERAKKCVRCGCVKEARDFGVNRTKKDSLHVCCRGCLSAGDATKPRREPHDDPKECGQCGVVKPATEFHINKRSSTGRQMKCKQCMSEMTRELNARRREYDVGAFIQRSKKRCSICGEEKKVDQFNRHRYSADGLLHACKPCLYAESRRWIMQKRAAAKALAEVEALDGAELSR